MTVDDLVEIMKGLQASGRGSARVLLTETYQIDDGDGYMDDMERSVDFLVNATFGDVIYIERVDK
jgi:hypothetical protein